MSTPIEKRIYAKLNADSSVTALVGTRIYPIQLAQATLLPALVYMRLSTERIHHLEGYSGVEMPTMQIMCYGETYDQAKEVADVVMASLHAATTFNAYCTNQVEDFDDDPEVYRIILEFGTWNEED